MAVTNPQDYIKQLATPTSAGPELKPTEFNTQFQSAFGRAPTADESGSFIQEQSLASPYTPPAPTPVPYNDGAPNVSQSTSNIRADQTKTQYKAADILDQAKQLAAEQTAGLKSEREDLGKLMQETKTLSELDLNNIDKAGAAAGLAYDPLIQQAEESKRQGLAKAVVGAGQRGGFMNTQYAGQAALTQVNDNTFVGAGGELSKVKGQLELNISKLRIAKQQAIDAAKAAAQKAILTGKQQDFDNASSLFEKSKQIFETEQNAIQQHINTVAKLQDIEQTQIKFQQDNEDRVVKYTAPTLVDVDENGNIITPTDADIYKIAQESGVDPNMLGAAVNEQIATLSKATMDKRKALLDETKTNAEIEATKALTEQRNASTLKTLGKVGGSGAKSSSKNYTSTTIPQNIKKDLIDDISSGQVDTNQIYSLYPEVDTKYISDLMDIIDPAQSNTSNKSQDTNTPQEFTWWNPTTWI